MRLVESLRTLGIIKTALSPASYDGRVERKTASNANDRIQWIKTLRTQTELL